MATTESELYAAHAAPRRDPLGLARAHMDAAVRRLKSARDHVGCDDELMDAVESLERAGALITHSILLVHEQASANAAEAADGRDGVTLPAATSVVAVAEAAGEGRGGETTAPGVPPVASVLPPGPTMKNGLDMDRRPEQWP